MAQYAWKRKPKGAPKATVAGKYLAGLSRKHNGISAEVLVCESRKARALLHRCFEWDNRKAAAKYRQVQAGTILRSLVVVVQQSDDEEPVQVNAFVNLEDAPEYLPVQVVMADEDMDVRYKKLLFGDLKQLKRKCDQYDEFTEVCHAIGRIRIR
jgi:hypothetical protein